MKEQKKGFIVHFQDNFHSLNQELKKLEHLSNLVDKPSENTLFTTLGC